MKERFGQINLRQLGERLKQFRFPALILLVGLILLMIPTAPAAEDPTEAAEPVLEVNRESTEARLERLLSQVDGAGSVSVMLTVARGEETVYQRDEVREQQGDSSAVTVTTVLASADTSQETPLEVTVHSPIYLGAVVVAEGGNVPSVRLDLVNAVSSLTGLGSDKITVIKMKAN